VANDVHRALRAAHASFIVVVSACVVGILLCIPRWSDGPRVRALGLLDRVATELNPAVIERSLLRQAETGETQNLEGITEKVAGPGVEDLTAGSAQPALFRAQALGMRTLGELLAQAREGHAVTLAGPDLDSLARSLRWRIARAGGIGVMTLTDLRAVDGSASEAELARESGVEALRLSAIAARRDYDIAHARLDFLSERVKAMAAAGAPRKALWKMQEKKQEALLEAETRKQAMEQAVDAYRKSADRAFAFVKSPDNPQGSSVVVVASLRAADGKSKQWRIPAPRVSREAKVSPVAVPEALTALSHDPLWPRLEVLSAEEARTLLRDELSFQARKVGSGPLTVRGAAVLSAFPLLLVLLLWRVSRQGRAVQRAYSPFDHPGASLPRLGTGWPKLDRLLLTLPVAVVGILAVWTLIRIDSLFWLAALLGAGALGYAARVAEIWDEVHDLRTNIVRTSMPLQRA
jgi:hypothetical protein